MSWLLIAFGLIGICVSQQCLSSPAEMVLTENDGIYYGELSFDAATFTINDVTFTTRVHDGNIPSPTIRFISGNIYNITLHNNLGPEDKGTTMNVVKDVNWTNIHTHGLHISGEAPADDVFVVAPPGETISYLYEIPCDHSGGTLWYHPHHHGSTAVQVGGGAAGAIIVEPNEYEITSFPDWYMGLYDNEIVLVIQHLNLASIASAGSGVDKLFTTSSNTAFFTVNGLYQPTICLTTNIWTKLRIVFSDIDSSRTMTVNGDSCSIYLLSKDGVLIHGINNQVPRGIPSKQMYFTVASRADVAIRCYSAASYTVTSGNTVVVNIEVTDDVNANANYTGNATELTPFNPLRPSYLQSLLFYSGSVGRKEVFLDDEEVNGETFSSENNYLFSFPVDTVQEWEISTDEGDHPYHVHVNHFQLLNCGNGPSGWSEVGDWLDTIDFDSTIRFYTDTFGGKVVIHCHRLLHEDEGLMAVVRIEGGCDALKGDVDSSGLQCIYDECSNLTLSSSFSSYNWTSESEGFTPEECPTGGLSTAAIVGIAVGSTVFFCCVIGIGVFCYVKKRRKRENDTSANTEMAMNQE